MALSWAAASGLLAFYTASASVLAVCLWGLAAAALFASLGALAKTQDCMSQIFGEPSLDGPPARDADVDPKPQPRESPRRGAAPSCCYSLIANTSPARAPAAAAQHQPACNADVADEAVPSPACTLLAAAAHSADTSRAGSAANSGQSAAAPPAAVVDSVLAVAALRRNNLRYRSPYTIARNAMAIGGGDVGRDVGRVRGRTQLHIKIPHLDPRDLRPDLVNAVNDSLRESDSGMMVVGAYVRRGCVELTLDLVESASKAKAIEGDNGGSVGGCGVQYHELTLSTLVLSALRVPPPPPAAAAADGEPRAVLFQRGSARWSMEWDRGAEQWRPQGLNGAGDAFSSNRVGLSAPMAVHAATQLAPGAAASGRGTLRLAVGLRTEGDAAAAAVHSSASAFAEALTVVAKANGRAVAVPVISVSPRQSVGAGAFASPTHGSLSSAASVMVLDVDLARLAAGRPEASLGLVVRLELWRRSARGGGAGGGGGYALLDSVSVACLTGERAVSELLSVQRELAAAGWLDPEDEAYVSPAQQRDEAEQLLGDLGAWLDFVAAAEAEAPPPLPSRDSLDLSDQVSALLRSAVMQPTMLGAGRHLLRYFVHQGHVALARAVQADLAPRLAAAVGAAMDVDGGAGGDQDEDGGEDGLPLLHRAVRSGRREMVELVLAWACGGGGGDAAVAAGGSAVWDARGADGLTALHLLVADARCGGGAAATAAAETPPLPPAEELLRWILATWPGAVTVWNTALDASGNTPAMLWAALGGPELQVAAAAAALERQVATGADLRGRGLGLAADGIALSGGATLLEPAGPSVEAAVAAHRPPPAAAGQESELQELLRGPLPQSTPGLLQMLRLSLRGFASPSLEREYVSYVTRTTAPSVLMWVVIMVVAHVTAFFKSPNWGEGRQAVIGGSGYLVSLAVMALCPRAYAPARERLMLACLLGRTLCRLLITTLPGLLHMSDSVQKYVFYGVDVLLDGFMEGTFEPVRVRQALVARLVVEWPILAAFMLSLGVRRTYGAALLRAAAVSFAGAAMSAVTDLRTRVMFLREIRTRAGVGGTCSAAAAAAAAVGEKEKRKQKTS